MAGKQNNKRFISHGTPFKYDFLDVFSLSYSYSPALFTFFSILSIVQREWGGLDEMQIIEMNKMDLRL